MIVLCRCLQCERLRMDNNGVSYNPRFFLGHHEFIETILTLDDNLPTTMEMKFCIHGDPLPLLRNAQHDQHYSIDEIEIFKHCLTDLIVGHIFVPFSQEDSIQLEIFYHLKSQDRWVPEDAFQSLSEELLQAMSGVFYPDMTQVQETINYKAYCDQEIGMIVIRLKNEFNNYNENEFDSPLI